MGGRATGSCLAPAATESRRPANSAPPQKKDEAVGELRQDDGRLDSFTVLSLGTGFLHKFVGAVGEDEGSKDDKGDHGMGLVCGLFVSLIALTARTVPDRLQKFLSGSYLCLLSCNESVSGCG